MAARFTWPGRLLRALLAQRGATVVHLLEPSARRDLAIVGETRARVELLVEDAAAFEILAYARAALRLPGAMAEAGVFAGGTARLLCEVKGARPLHLFDVFETLQGEAAAAPEGTRAAELRGHFKSWHRPRAAVERLLAPYPAVQLHAGVFPESTRGLEDERFCFVHVDLDLESGTRDALEFFLPRMPAGAILIGDDYGIPAVRRAFDAAFAGRTDTLIALPWGQAVVVRAATSGSDEAG